LNRRFEPPHPTVPTFATRSLQGPTFVGRERELAVLRACLHQLGQGRGSIALILGEPGIGKTRLAEEIMTDAGAAGRLTVRGNCWEGGGAPPYWPWIEALRTCARQIDLGAVPDHVAVDLRELDLVPSSTARVPAAAPTDHERARFRLFDAVAVFLRSASAQRPLVVVLDDLHAADQPTLLLLQFVARELRDAPVFLLGCYRDAYARGDVNVHATLAAIARNAVALPLYGFAEAEVGVIVDRASSRPASPAVKAAVFQATGGNPFFVDEVVRALAASGRLHDEAAVVLPVPGGVRGAILERSTNLSPASRRILSVAVIIGHEFDVPVLSRAASVSATAVLTAVTDARASALVVERNDVLGRYAFRHGIVRETFYAEVPLEERAAAHRRVADALETLYARDRDAHVAELAYHFAMAVPQGDPGKAIACCRQAGDHAIRRLAAEEAVGHYTRAVQVLAVTGGDEALRCELLLALGYAHEAAGQLETARLTFTEAARIARRRDDVASFVRAALGPGELWARKFVASIFEKSDVALLEEALHVAADEPTRCRVMARLGPALATAGAPARGRDCSEAALATARALGDRELLAHALLARHATLLVPSHVEERLAIGNEVVRVGADIGNAELVLRGHFFRFHDLAESGDVIAATLENASLAAQMQDVRDPFEERNLTINEAAVALFEGRIDASEESAQRAATLAHRTAGPQARNENVGIVVLLQFVMIRREQLRLAEMERELRQLAAAYPWIVGIHALLALVELERRNLDGVQRELDLLANDAFASVPFDVAWLGTMCVVAELCAALRDRDRAALVYERLLPFRHRNAVVAGTSWLGTVERYLGLVAHSCGRLDEAVAHLRTACAWHERTGGALWLGHSYVELAAALRERSAPGDLGQAETALAHARRLAHASPSARLHERIAAAADRPSDACLEGRPRGSDGRVIRKEGEYWTVLYAGTVVRLKMSAGMTCLAYLLHHPRREFHASELLAEVYRTPSDAFAAGDRTGSVAPAGVRGAPSIEVIDAAALTAYRTRIRELRAELEAAKEQDDAPRVDALQREFDVLTRELGRGLGWGGRSRRAGSPGERARVNVTRMMRTAIARIAAVHSELARHLRAAIRTGTFCAYHPPAGDETWGA
jgi:tetratricopeptide (TPR) repeat protein